MRNCRLPRLPLPASVRSLSNFIPALRRLTPPPPPNNAVEASPLFRLPTELRIQIYEYVLADSSLCPLYIEGHNVRALQRSPSSGTHTALMRTCRAVHLEATDLLYENHTLHLLLLRPSLVEDHRHYPVVCDLSDLKRHLERLQNVSMTVEYGSSVFQQYTAALVLRWVWYVLRSRPSPPAHVTIRMTDDERNRCAPCCTAEMEEVGRRFKRFDQPPKVVFEAWESECWCVKGWTGAIGPQGQPKEAADVTEADVRDAVVQGTERVPRAWWRLREWFLYL